MKRSDMINMMASNLWFWYGQFDSLTNEWEKEDILVKETYLGEATMLLSLMEGGGMVPPPYFISANEANKNRDPEEGVYFASVSVNKWESENE